MEGAERSVRAHRGTPGRRYLAVLEQSERDPGGTRGARAHHHPLLFYPQRYGELLGGPVQPADTVNRVPTFFPTYEASGSQGCVILREEAPGISAPELEVPALAIGIK